MKCRLAVRSTPSQVVLGLRALFYPPSKLMDHSELL